MRLPLAWYHYLKMPRHSQWLVGKSVWSFRFRPADQPTSWRGHSHRCWAMRSNRLSWSITAEGQAAHWGQTPWPRSAPDGRTLLMATVGTHAINPALYKKLPYDAVRDFTPIALVAIAPVAIVVHPSQPVNNIAELVALAKRMPGKLNYGSAGAGTPGHLTGEMFKSAAGIDIQHVPYRGSAPAVTDLIGGQLQIMFDPLQSVLSNVQGGQVRAIAVSSKVRSPSAVGCADDHRVRLRRIRDHGVVGIVCSGEAACQRGASPWRRNRTHCREARLCAAISNRWACSRLS